MRLLLWVVVLAVVQIPSPADNKGPLTPALLREHFVQDIASHDVEDLLPLFTPDAELIQPGAPPATGHAALRSRFADEFAHQDTVIELGHATHDLEGEPHHPTGWSDAGSYVERSRLHSGETRRSCGSYTFRFTRNPDGGWLIARIVLTEGECGAQPAR